MPAASDSPTLRRVVVVGASLAGLRAAEELRRLGFDGTVTLVGAEPHLPYDRPPLSKDFLAGETDADGLTLRRQPYDDLALDLRLGVRATALDPSARTITTDDGDTIPYDGAVIATGAAPRRLPNTPDLAGIHVLRTLDDAGALRADLDRAPSVVVVGAGFIGAEVAATCRARGLKVTVLEALPTPMVRGLGTALGNTLAGLHRDHGVDLRTGVGVAGFEGGDRVAGVRLDDGSIVDGDVVVVGVGVAPSTAWLESSGLTLDNGVVCDHTLLAAPGVVAAGDVARWPNPAFGGTVMRLEHWTNATEQGVAAAARLLAGDDAAEPFGPIPFVWSDQYDVKIQVAGHVTGDDEVEVVDGSLDERRFVALFGRAGRLTGAVAFSRPRLLMQYRRMISEGVTFADALASARERVRSSADRPPLITGRFVTVVASGIFYFISIGVVIPAIPRFVKHRLDGGSIAVGVVVGALFVGAVILRPLAGRIGDRYGRKLLVIAGSLTVGVSMLCYALANSIPALVGARVLTGVGEAAFFVGAATMITDLAPVERRGEAISYWSVAVYSGFAFGPAIGEAVQRTWGYETLWYVAAGLGFTSAIIGTFTREVEREKTAGPPGPLLNRKALGPGSVLFAGLIATAAFSAFVPLYADDVGIEDVAIVFVVFGVLVLLIRVIGARIPDALGGARSGTVALVTTAIGMAVMAVWGTATGLMTGVVLFAVGQAFLYPAMLLLALEGTDDSERGSAVGTISSCFDLSQGLGSLVVGGVAALTSYRGTFATGAVCSALAVLLLWGRVMPRMAARARVANEVT